jgi:NADP-dependent 3-hydroxy acid dehydrogenase YdfG
MDSAEMRPHFSRRERREDGNPSPAKGTANPDSGSRKSDPADLGRLADGVETTACTQRPSKHARNVVDLAYARASPSSSPSRRDAPMTQTPDITPFDAQPLKGKTILVTGGAQGIGRGIAQAVLGAGGNVFIGDLNAAAGKACLDEWKVGKRAGFATLDVSREPIVKRWTASALRQFGRIDGLVNNAGIASPHTGPLTELSLDKWNRYLSTNLTGVFLCAKHALAELSRHRGAIVNIASTRALQSEADSEAYAATKGGLLAFTHALAISAGPDVRTNAILPG